MNSPRTRARRWIPVAVMTPVALLGAVAVPVAAQATTPAPTTRSVLASIAGSADAAYSGKVSQTSDLGLPQLPASTMPSGAGASSAGSAASTIELLTADHTARVYVDGTGKQRIQVLDSLAERDVIHNGSTVWTWDSKKNAATRTTLPARTESPDMGSQTPSTLAARFLDAVGPSTKVSDPVATRFVGRDAYRITLTPRTSTTLVAEVVLTVDKATGLPLSTVVDAKGQSTPAVEVAYTSISFSTPSASLFDFTPPSDAKVTKKDLSAGAGARRHMHPGPVTPGSAASNAPRPTVTGTGWDAIVSLPAGSATTSGLDASGSKLLDELTKPVTGGRAIETSLFTVLLQDDGGVLVGAVPVSALQAAIQ